MTTPATDRKDHLDLLAVGLLVVCCAFWGYQQILIKTTIAEIPPLWQVSLRFFGSLAILVVWCHWRRIPLWERDGTLVGGVVSGSFFALELACVYLGMRLTTASRQTVLLYVAPFVVAILLPRFVPSEGLKRGQWLGLAIAFGSVALAVGEGMFGSPHHDSQLLGDLVGVSAGILWGLAMLSMRISSLARTRPEKVMLYQVLVPALILPVLSLFKGETWSLHYSAQAWLSVFLQTAIGGFGTFLVWMWILRHYPATLVSSFAFLTPVFALALGVLLLGEPITTTLVLALLGVTFGILLINRIVLR